MHLISLTGGTGWHVQDLHRAAAVLGITHTACNWRQIVTRVGVDGPRIVAEDVSLDDADAVLLRTMPPGSLEQIILRMDAMHLLSEAGVCVVNPPRAIEIAVDKYLALARMQSAGLPVPRTITCQRMVDAMAAFEQLGGDVVVKAIFGSESFGMTRISDADLAARAFTMLERQQSVIYLQQFVPHDGTDLRLLVLGRRVLATMRRRSESGDWRTNVARGGVGEVIAVDDATAALGIKAAAACSTEVAGVDVLIGKDGKPYVLEVNAVPGWRELARVTQIDIAAEVLRHVATMAKERGRG